MRERIERYRVCYECYRAAAFFDYSPLDSAYDDVEIAHKRECVIDENIARLSKCEEGESVRLVAGERKMVVTPYPCRCCGLKPEGERYELLKIIQSRDVNDVIKEASYKRRFRGIALEILKTASIRPVNPWDYFQLSVSRRRAYDYFNRLIKYGYLRQCAAPKGRRGKWYELDI